MYKLLMLTDKLTEGLYAFSLGAMAALPYVWCLVFRALFMPLLCNWECWLYVWSIVMVHGLVVLCACFKAKYTDIAKNLGLLCVLGILILLFDEKYGEWGAIIRPTVFLFNLIIMCVWTTKCLITINICGPPYSRVFETGIFTMMLFYYYMLQSGMVDCLPFWVPIIVVGLWGVLAFEFLRGRPCFAKALKTKHNIYYFGKGTYIVESPLAMIKRVKFELLYLILTVIALVVCLTAIQYLTNTLSGLQTFYILLMVGPILGGLTSRNLWVPILYNVLMVAMSIIVLLDPRWLIVGLRERLVILIVTMTNCVAACLLERIKRALEKTINGSQFSVVTTMLYSFVLALSVVSLSL